MAVGALGGQELLGVGDAFWGQQLFQMGRMIGLAAALAFGFLLLDGLGGAQGIGGRRRRRVTGVGINLGKQIANLRLQFLNAVFENSTSWTSWFRHTEYHIKTASRQLRQFADGERLPFLFGMRNVRR